MKFDVFKGVLVWIWELWSFEGGDYDAIAARLKTAGVTTVLLKAADGGHWYPQADAHGAVSFARACYELQRRGLTVIAWVYCYLSDIGDVFYRWETAGWQAEAQIAVQTVTYRPPELPDYRGPDGLCLDVEAEAEGYVNSAPSTSVRAMNMATTILAGVPKDFPLAYAPLPSIRNHLMLPYSEFTRAGFAMLPQLYYTGLQWSVGKTVEEFYNDASAYALEQQPIFPAYEDAPGARSSGDQLVEFSNRIASHGATGASVWSAQHLDAAGWDRVAWLSHVFAPVPVQPPAPPEPAPAPAAPTNDDLVEIFRLTLGGNYGAARDYLASFV